MAEEKDFLSILEDIKKKPPSTANSKQRTDHFRRKKEQPQPRMSLETWVLIIFISLILFTSIVLAIMYSNKETFIVDDDDDEDEKKKKNSS